MVQKETKNRNRLNIIGPLVAVLLVLSLFSGIAAADTPREKYQEIKEKYQVYEDKYRIAGDKFNDEEQKFRDARNKFKAAKDTKSKEELKVRTAQYLGSGIDKMNAHLEVMANRIGSSGNDIFPFDAAANIDTHIAALEEIRTNIRQAGTPGELVDYAGELKDQWAMIRLETRYTSGILINNRIDAFMEKSENVSERMDAVIQDIGSEGKDTAKLERIAESFNKIMNEARVNHQYVLGLYEIHAGFDENGTVTDARVAQSFLSEAERSQKETHRMLKAASKEVREFFNEATKNNTKRAVISGNGTLEASGNGRAVIKGDVNVTLSAINGTLVVSNNSEVTTDGTGTREELGNGNIKYEGFGSATISGERITVGISGNGIELKANGTGTAILNGKGTYKTEGSFGTGGEWKQED